MSESAPQRVLRAVCTFRTQLIGLFAVCLLLFLLTVASLVVIEPGTPAYAVSKLNLIGTVVFGSAAGSLTYLCKRRG